MGNIKASVEYLPSTTLALRTPPEGQEWIPRRAARLLHPPLS
jgi:hypothetical protein